MFEISTLQLKNCIKELEEQEKQLNNLIRRMDTVYTGFDGLAEDKSDKKALFRCFEQMQSERRDIACLRQTLVEIIQCYEKTESKLVNENVLRGKKNYFGAVNLRRVEQGLHSLNIVFR